MRGVVVAALLVARLAFGDAEEILSNHRGVLPAGVRFGPYTCGQLDVNARAGATQYCKTCVNPSDPAQCCTAESGSKDCGAFCYKLPGSTITNGRWACGAGTCMNCPDVTACCTPDGGTCTQGNQCCDGSCILGICQTCLVNGNTCATNNQCCSAQCVNSVCCTPLSGACSVNGDCCSGVCTGGVCTPQTTTSTTTSTTTTTSTSTSTLNTSTTTSTSSTTSTSTTLCNAVGATQPGPNSAPDWRGDARFLTVIDYDANGNPQLDSSSSNNNLSGQSTMDFTFAQQGCASKSVPGTNGSTNQCQVGSPCAPSAFYFLGDSFTAGGWYRIATPPCSTCGAGLWGTVSLYGNPGWWLFISNGFAPAGPGQKWVFLIASTTNFGTVSIANWATATWTHVVGRYDASATQARIYVNGALDHSTNSVAALTNNGSNLSSPIGTRNMQGNYDEQYVFHGVMVDEDICRIAVCGIDGWGCTCSGTTYTSAPKHVTFGGFLSCTLPTNCAKPGPT